MTSRLSSVVAMRTFTILFLLQIFCLAENTMAQFGYTLRSPDQKIEVRIQIADRFKYDVSFNGNLLLHDSALSIKIDQTTLGLQPKVKAKKERTVNQEIVPPVPQK